MKGCEEDDNFTEDQLNIFLSQSFVNEQVNVVHAFVLLSFRHVPKNLQYARKNHKFRSVVNNSCSEI